MSTTKGNKLAVSEGLVQSSNPLEIVGLDILVSRLGLSRTDLHHVVKRYARELSVVTHEDKGGNPELARRYAKAYSDLQDEKIFDLALSELRALSNEKNRDVSTQIQNLKTTIAKQHEKIARLEQREMDFGGKALQAKLHKMHQYIATSGMKLTMIDTLHKPSTVIGKSIAATQFIDLVLLKFSGARRKPVIKDGEVLYRKQDFTRLASDYGQMHKEAGLVNETRAPLQQVVRELAGYQSWVILRKLRVPLDNGFFSIDGVSYRVIGSVAPRYVSSASVQSDKGISIVEGYFRTRLEKMIGVMEPILWRHSWLLVDGGISEKIIKATTEEEIIDRCNLDIEEKVKKMDQLSLTTLIGFIADFQ